jgi:hypothetical protein
MILSGCQRFCEKLVKIIWKLIESKSLREAEAEKLHPSQGQLWQHI